MPLSTIWDETDPDGDIKTVSVLDDVIRDMKVAVRERLEGDPIAPLTGLFEFGSFPTAPTPRAGSARIFSSDTASLASLPQQDGRLAITTDTKRLYHLRAGGPVEVNYLTIDGTRSPTANLPMGGKKITGLAAGTVAGDAVRFEQAALIDQVRTITGLWTFNRGGGNAPFAVSDPTVVINLNADKLDGQDAAAFAPVVHTHAVGDITSGTFAVARGGTGISGYAIGDLLYASSASALARLAHSSAWKTLIAGATTPVWAGNVHYAYSDANTVNNAIMSPITTAQAVEAGSAYLVEYNIGFASVAAGGIQLQVQAPSGSTVISFFQEGSTTYNVLPGNTTPTILGGTTNRIVRCFAQVGVGVAGNVTLGMVSVGGGNTNFALITSRITRIS